MRRYLPLAVAALLPAACVKTYTETTVEVGPEGLRREEPLRPASNLPTGFVVVTAGATSADCPGTLRDPALNSTLTLRRALLVPVRDSAGVNYMGLGDYSVEPQGLYGDQPGDGLRVECTRLRALGVVRLGTG